MSVTEARSARILIVEDEESIADVVRTALRFKGHDVDHVSGGMQGLERGLSGSFDLIILDVMLPGIDGLEVCGRLRAQGVVAPVLFLTARATEDDRINGFVAGGDDYLAKPFSIDELVLRVHAILRRTAGPAPTDLLRVADLTFDPGAYEVRRAGVIIDLSPTELRLLEYLMLNTGVVVSKAQILASVWDCDFDGSENVVELYVGYLRRKIDDGHSPLIQTRRGAGYVLREGER